MGVGAPHQCPRVNKNEVDERGSCHTGLAVSAAARFQVVQLVSGHGFIDYSFQHLSGVPRLQGRRFALLCSRVGVEM